MCMLGFWASVRLMEEFAVVLKPLILALMLAGCLEKAVELCRSPLKGFKQDEKR